MMLSNSDCTVYENIGKGANVSIAARHFIPNVYWNDCRGRVLKKNGIQIEDSIIVYVFYGTDYVPKLGDIIVKGNADFEFDNTSQETMSASDKQFKQLYPQFAVVKSVSDYKFGGLPHIEITAR
ncbi:MAG: hypothetical protein II931_00295 [Clostridia bacterium]|nr:hypothetical protein [Clostridia bacterium]